MRTIRPTIHDNDIHPNAWRTIREELAKYKEGSVVAITIQKAKKKISKNQHGYYRDLVLPMATSFIREFGNEVSTEEVHNWAKAQWGAKKDIVMPDGDIVSNPKSMANYSTVEAANLVEGLRAWCGEYGCVIPDPSTAFLGV